jgi:SAM-dependent methyltransferase
MRIGPFAPAPAGPGLYDALAAEGLGRDLFGPRQHECCERVEHYVLHLAFDTLGRLGAVPPADRARDLPALCREAGIVDGFRARLAWLLDLLVAAGALARDASGYRLAAAPSGTSPDALRAAALAADARYAPTYELIDEAARLYPPVARGETLAEPALLGRPRLWVRYFSNDNPYYALGNHVAACAAAARIRPGARVLEVGGGLGSSAGALLAALVAREAPPSAYRLTDPVPFFRRRAARELVPPGGCELETAALDMNAPWEPQGVAPASWDLVWGVNAFHLARDQDAVLAEARRALRPGGLIVLGEGLRRHRRVPEPTEFPFQLLESFHAVRLDDRYRPSPGFPHPPDLVRALETAGFAQVEVVPAPERIAPHYAGFLGGAVSARRPSERAASSPT